LGQRHQSVPASPAGCSAGFSARCQSTARGQSERLTVVPCFWAAPRQSPLLGTAPSSDVRSTSEPRRNDALTMPYSAASVDERRRPKFCDRTPTNGNFRQRAKILPARVVHVKHSLSRPVTASTRNSRRMIDDSSSWRDRAFVIGHRMQRAFMRRRRPVRPVRSRRWRGPHAPSCGSSGYHGAGPDSCKGWYE